ncbi:MAG: hypothetical protein WCO66_03990 [Candidatus Absconditabacteria bacterium]
MNKKIIIGLMALASMTLVLTQGANAATAKKTAPSKVQVQQSKNGAKIIANKKTVDNKKTEQKPKLGSGDKPGMGSGQKPGEGPKLGSGDKEHLGSGQKLGSGDKEHLGSGDKIDMKLEIKPLKDLVQQIDEILQKSRVQAIKDALSSAKKTLQAQIPAPTTGTVAK